MTVASLNQVVKQHNYKVDKAKARPTKQELINAITRSEPAEPSRGANGAVEGWSGEQQNTLTDEMNLQVDNAHNQHFRSINEFWLTVHDGLILTDPSWPRSANSYNRFADRVLARGSETGNKPITPEDENFRIAYKRALEVCVPAPAIPGGVHSRLPAGFIPRSSVAQIPLVDESSLSLVTIPDSEAEPSTLISPSTVRNTVPRSQSVPGSGVGSPVSSPAVNPSTPINAKTSSSSKARQSPAAIREAENQTNITQLITYQISHNNRMIQMYETERQDKERQQKTAADDPAKQPAADHKQAMEMMQFQLEMSRQNNNALILAVTGNRNDAQHNNAAVHGAPHQAAVQSVESQSISRRALTEEEQEEFELFLQYKRQRNV